MNILEFERRVKVVLRVDDEDFGTLYEEELQLFIHRDGCLGCKFKGISVPCEGLPWDEALDRIVKFAET